MPSSTALIPALVVSAAVAICGVSAEDGAPVVAVAAGKAAVPVPVSTTPHLLVIGADKQERARVDEAVARFTTNRLPLPDLEIRFFDDEAGCNGHLGLFQRRHTPWRILVCSELDFVITHELAHAWESANLSDDDRARYLEAHDLTNWNDHTRPWLERGTERAAFVIQKNLMTESASARSTAWDEWTDAYELLTGMESPVRR